MNELTDKQKAKNQVTEQISDVCPEELGLKALKHYEYLTTLNHEWNSYCANAIKNYEKLKNQLEEARELFEEIVDNQGNKAVKRYLEKYKDKI
jgi:hypothetical protein